MKVSDTLIYRNKEIITEVKSFITQASGLTTFLTTFLNGSSSHSVLRDQPYKYFKAVIYSFGKVSCHHFTSLIFKTGECETPSLSQSSRLSAEISLER